MLINTYLTHLPIKTGIHEHTPIFFALLLFALHRASDRKTLPALLATGRYTLKVAFGHPSDVAVLDGGLPRWKELGARQLLCRKTMGYPETLEGAEGETRREGMMR